MRLKTLFFMLLLVATTATKATEPANSEFKPSGKVFGSAFTGFNTLHSNGSNEKTSKSFVLDRLELGYIYQFSENWLFKGCFDISDPKDESTLQHTAFARNAFGEYHNDKLIVRFGMITGISFNFVENSWGHRYIAKCYQEYFDYSASRDIGITGSYAFNDKLSVDGIISNGEGYKLKQQDTYLEYGIGVTFRPFNRWVFRGYTDITETDVLNENTYAAMIGYEFNNGSSIGAEYNAQRNGEVTKGKNQSGCSFYSTVEICENWHIYARYDYNDRNETWDSGNNANVFFAGVQFSPRKGIKITPNYIHSSHSVASFCTENEYRLSCEFKF
ncbi:MAG: hypothetical protein ACK5IJ_00440 [Mangrovibacterium sp.]